MSKPCFRPPPLEMGWNFAMTKFRRQRNFFPGTIEPLSHCPEGVPFRSPGAEESPDGLAHASVNRLFRPVVDNQIAGSARTTKLLVERRPLHLEVIATKDGAGPHKPRGVLEISHNRCVLVIG